MKLRNKKTGEIVELVGEFKRSDGKPDFTLDSYETLAELNEELEDAPEEPKEYYFITDTGQVKWDPYDDDETDRESKEIGNYFETKEEAEKAVEKLKAWQRLKDRGFRFTGFSGGRTIIEFTFDKSGEPSSASKDLDLLFGGEE